MDAPTGLQILMYGPNELANHCHLWKNAREGGILVNQQAITDQNIKYINHAVFFLDIECPL